MQKFAEIPSFLQPVEAARRHYGAPRAATYARALRLRRARFSATEILLWGLLDPALDDKALAQYVSKRRLLKFQASQSPAGHAVLVEDKEVFYRYCEVIDLPIPETVAFMSRSAVWFSEGHPHASETTLQARLRALEGIELIVKPADGVYGIGVRALRVQAGRFVEGGTLRSLTELMRELSPGTRYVLQRRLSNHAAIEALTGFRTLQTLRVLTAMPRQPGAPARIMSAALRLSAQDSVANNFDYGRHGTVRARIDIESGKIVRAVRASPSGFGLEDVERMARSGIALPGIEMPHWARMKALLEVKAPCFYPIRLVGWDVALTPEEPVVVEGNFWFDPSDNAFGEVKEFIERTIALG